MKNNKTKAIEKKYKKRLINKSQREKTGGPTSKGGFRGASAGKRGGKRGGRAGRGRS